MKLFMVEIIKKSKRACVQFNKVDEVEKLSMVGTLKN